MDDKFEKKLKEFLPYIIIIGVVYLFAPAILVFTNSRGLLNQLIYIGLFPLTALLCSVFYGYKKTNDFFFSLIAPLLYIPSMLLYGNVRDSLLNSLIFLVSYFICGYIGLTLGDMFKGSKAKDEKPKRQKKVPAVVDTSSVNTYEELEEIEPVEQFESTSTFEEPALEQPVYQPSSSYSEDDVDAILAELHNRNS